MSNFNTSSPAREAVRNAALKKREEKVQSVLKEFAHEAFILIDLSDAGSVVPLARVEDVLRKALS